MDQMSSGRTHHGTPHRRQQASMGTLTTLVSIVTAYKPEHSSGIVTVASWYGGKYAVKDNIEWIVTVS
jgi:hypothetical protein